jgi:hypothetical protein
MTDPPNDTTLIDQWLDEAEELAEGFDFNEEEWPWVDRVLEGYEASFRRLGGGGGAGAGAGAAADAATSFPNPLRISAEHIHALCARDQTEQRTPAWYAQMEHLLSASEFGALYGTARARAQLVLAKVNFTPRISQSLAVHNAEMSAFDWGIRFEPVVKQIYELKYGATVQELGRMISPVDPRVSASPDGLITAAADPARVGRLIEIKCPVTRKPDGKVPKDYYTQMQLQLHVTGLKECDFVEVVFDSPYSSPLHRTPPSVSSSSSSLEGSAAAAPLYRGEVLLVQKNVLTEDGSFAALFRYEYSHVNPVGGIWSPNLKEGEFVAERSPWSVSSWHEQVVVAAPGWWEAAKPLVDRFWEDVEKAKADPTYLREHQAPVRPKAAAATATLESMVCVIKLGT